jgi:hypothetical protein
VEEARSCSWWCSVRRETSAGGAAWRRGGRHEEEAVLPLLVERGKKAEEVVWPGGHRGVGGRARGVQLDEDGGVARMSAAPPWQENRQQSEGGTVAASMEQSK